MTKLSSYNDTSCGGRSFWSDLAGWTEKKRIPIINARGPGRKWSRVWKLILQLNPVQTWPEVKYSFGRTGLNHSFTLCGNENVPKQCTSQL